MGSFPGTESVHSPSKRWRHRFPMKIAPRPPLREPEKAAALSGISSGIVDSILGFGATGRETYHECWVETALHLLCEVFSKKTATAPFKFFEPLW